MTISAKFHELFGAAPEVIAAAPGRVNLIGEHVDFSDGFVLPFAIADRTTAAISKRNDRIIRVASIQRRCEIFTSTLDEFAPMKKGKWERYLLGVLWAMEITQGVDLLIDGHVPVGAGLSSSAALECSIAIAINDLFDCGHSIEQLARIAQRAENAYVGMPCGIMDQSVSLMAREGSALLLDCRDLSTRHIPFDVASHGLELLIIDTQVHHALVDGGYAERRGDCEKVSAIMGVKALRDLTMSELQSRKSEITPTQFLRARHGVSEMERVRAGVDALERNDFDTFGELINQTHTSLRDDYTVSCPELDLSVETAQSLGALGARMIGGGFGGSAIAIVKADHSKTISEAIAQGFANKNYKKPRFFTSLPSTGARVIRQG